MNSNALHVVFGTGQVGSALEENLAGRRVVNPILRGLAERATS
jgi:hypothetical protein